MDKGGNGDGGGGDGGGGDGGGDGGPGQVNDFYTFSARWPFIITERKAGKTPMLQRIKATAVRKLLHTERERDKESGRERVKE